MKTEEAQRIVDETHDLAMRIREVLKTFGSPKDVLTACTYILVRETQLHGVVSKEEFLKTVERFWNALES